MIRVILFVFVLVSVTFAEEAPNECDPGWRKLNPNATALEFSQWCREPATPEICHADANHDGSVDFQDLNIMKQEFFRDDCPPVRYANVTWETPTENADGTPLIDLAGFKIYYGTQPGTPTITIDIADPTAINQVIGLAPGTYYIMITAYDESGNESAMSEEVSVEILE